MHAITQTAVLRCQRAVNIEEMRGDIDAGPAGLSQHAAEMEDIRSGATADIESAAFVLRAGAQYTFDEPAKVHGAAIGLCELAPMVLQVAVFEPCGDLSVRYGVHRCPMPFDRSVEAFRRVRANRPA